MLFLFVLLIGAGVWRIVGTNWVAGNFYTSPLFIGLGLALPLDRALAIAPDVGQGQWKIADQQAPTGIVLRFFATPTNLLIFIILLGAVWACVSQRRRRMAQIVTLAATGLLAIGAFTPAGMALSFPLENRFPRWQNTSPEALTGIIVLGGAVDVRDKPDQMKLNESAERITALIELSRRFPQAKLVYSGRAEAEEVGGKIVRLGVDPGRMILESRARNTFENAQYSFDLLKPKPGERWLLVTSAWHMPRAIGTFRRVGFPVEAYPVDFRVIDFDREQSVLYAPGSESLRHLDVPAKEWVGLVYYWLVGKTDSLFPGPT
jgi:uncharacterized SAM-binding protein YcdF (DUF218 family)